MEKMSSERRELGLRGCACTYLDLPDGEVEEGHAVSDLDHRLGSNTSHRGSCSAPERTIDRESATSRTLVSELIRHLLPRRLWRCRLTETSVELEDGELPEDRSIGRLGQVRVGNDLVGTGRVNLVPDAGRTDGSEQARARRQLPEACDGRLRGLKGVGVRTASLPLPSRGGIG